MISEAPDALSDENDVVMQKPVSRSSPSKKNPEKVPKRIHKAEREKLKRDHLNVLFSELGRTLEPAHENNGKASILNESIQLLRDLLAQLDCLKRENATLLSESHYVTDERNELKEENSALEAQIEKLQNEIEEKVHSQSFWNSDPSQSHNNTTFQQLEDHLVVPVIDHAPPPAPVVGPVFLVPLPHDPQSYPKPDIPEDVSKLPSNLSKPHARYPSASDSWPSHILVKQNEATQQTSSSTSSGTSSRGGNQGFSAMCKT